MECVFLTTTRACHVAVTVRSGGGPCPLNKYVFLTASVSQKMMQETTEQLACCDCIAFELTKCRDPERHGRLDREHLPCVPWKVKGQASGYFHRPDEQEPSRHQGKSNRYDEYFISLSGHEVAPYLDAMPCLAATNRKDNGMGMDPVQASLHTSPPPQAPQHQKPYATTSPGISSAVCFPFAPPSFREEDDPALLLLLLLLLPQVPAMSITSKSPVVLFPPSL